MTNALSFYIDDSGTRHPDRNLLQQSHKPDWFALGGILIPDKDKALAESLCNVFCSTWNIHYPLHSSEIRGSNGNFRWLVDKEKKEQFMQDLSSLLCTLPVIGLACIIDRPGYNIRYEEKYRGARWMLCKTAFNISIERAAKYALANDYKLRVYPERSSKQDENILKRYYEELKSEGLPFNKETSSQYAPLTSSDFNATLYDFKIKTKSSILMQIADLYLYPMCRNGYADYLPYQMLKKAGKLLDCYLPENELALKGIKYSCFESVKKQKSD